jgi:hypothetical protein
MPGKVKVDALARAAEDRVRHSLEMYEEIRLFQDHYPKRWVSQFAAVDIHAIWERYAEDRLIAALNHNPAHFLRDKEIKGVARIPRGLASYIVRGGREFFDFKSPRDLIGIATKLVGKDDNPFRLLLDEQKCYLECLGKIRNLVVHRSDAAEQAYRHNLRGEPYRMKFVPEPFEFLNALDNRSGSPARGQPRVCGLAEMVIQAILWTADL